MNTIASSPLGIRSALIPISSALYLLLAVAPESNAQQQPQPNYYGGQMYAGGRLDNFYQRGDAMSEKVSGFMRRVFGGGQQQRSTVPPPAYSPPPQPNGYAYQQPVTQTTPAVSTQPPISNYQRPGTKPTTNVYGYSGSDSKPTLKSSYSAVGGASDQSFTTNKPAQPATRKKTPRKSIFQREKKPETTSPDPASGSSSLYTPPQVTTQPIVTQPPAPPPETKSNTISAPQETASSVSESFKMNTSPEPGTVINSPSTSSKKEVSPPPTTSTSLSSVVTTEPKKTETTAPTYSSDIPTGKKGSKAGRVISPYAPYNELDVTGLDSGSTALDPTTNKVFKVP